MCIGINKYGQMTDIGLFGQYSYRLGNQQNGMQPFYMNPGGLFGSSYPTISSYPSITTYSSTVPYPIHTPWFLPKGTI